MQILTLADRSPSYCAILTARICQNVGQPESCPAPRWVCWDGSKCCGPGWSHFKLDLCQTHFLWQVAVLGYEWVAAALLSPFMFSVGFSSQQPLSRRGCSKVKSVRLSVTLWMNEVNLSVVKLSDTPSERNTIHFNRNLSFTINCILGSEK